MLDVVVYVAWVFVPNLKYPANPPAVGDPDTVGQRTASYLLLLVVSMILAYVAWELWQRLTARGLDGAERFAAVAGTDAAAVTVAWLVFPANPDAIEVPANLIWHFRIQSLGGNAILWVVAGTVFGFPRRPCYRPVTGTDRRGRRPGRLTVGLANSSPGGRSGGTSPRL